MADDAPPMSARATLSDEEAQWSNITISTSCCTLLAGVLYMLFGWAVRSKAVDACGEYFIQRADGEIFTRMLLAFLYVATVVVYCIWVLYRKFKMHALGRSAGTTGLLLTIFVFSIASMLTFDTAANGAVRTYESQCGSAVRGIFGGGDIEGLRWSAFSLLVVCGALKVVMAMSFVQERIATDKKRRA